MEAIMLKTDLWQILEQDAQQQARSIADLVNEAIEQYLYKRHLLMNIATDEELLQPNLLTEHGIKSFHGYLTELRQQYQQRNPFAGLDDAQVVIQLRQQREAMFDE